MLYSCSLSIVYIRPEKNSIKWLDYKESASESISSLNHEHNLSHSDLRDTITVECSTDHLLEGRVITDYN